MNRYLCRILGNSSCDVEISAETPDQAAEAAVRNYCGFVGARLGEHLWRVEVRLPGVRHEPSTPLGTFTVSLQFGFKVEKA